MASVLIKNISWYVSLSCHSFIWLWYPGSFKCQATSRFFTWPRKISRAGFSENKARFIQAEEQKEAGAWAPLRKKQGARVQVHAGQIARELLSDVVSSFLEFYLFPSFVMPNSGPSFWLIGGLFCDFQDHLRDFLILFFAINCFLWSCMNEVGALWEDVGSSSLDLLGFSPNFFLRCLWIISHK